METQTLLLILVVSTLLFAGCTGNNQNTPVPVNVVTTPPSGNGTPIVVVSNASNASANLSVQPGTSPADQLGALFAAAGQPDYKVTYTYSMGQGAGATPVTMVQYKKGDKVRMDTNMNISGMGTISSEIFMLGNKTDTCSNYGQGFTCMESSAPNENQLPTVSTPPSTDTVELLAPTVVAGIPATCFRVTSPAEGGSPASSADYCVSSDGILLSMTSSAITMTATAVERGVDDSVFTLPAQLTTAPTGY